MIIQTIRCEHMERPLGITVKAPRFSWTLSAKEQNVWQTAYAVKVWETDGALVWDSQKVENCRDQICIYRGLPLTSAARYEFTIAVWDNLGGVYTSEAEWFETALFQADDWKAEWIEPAGLPQLDKNPLEEAYRIWQDTVDAMMRGESPEIVMEGDLLRSLPLYPYDPAVRMRRTFDLAGPVRRARLYMTAHGIYDVGINGTAVTDARLMPGFTSYDKRIRYQTYAVEHLLHEGENAIGVTVADGWYKGKIALGRGCEYGEVPGILVQLEIMYQDGTKEWVCSDGQWLYSYDGAIRTADLFLGEIYDARLDDGDCSAVDYDDKEWLPVLKGAITSAALESQMDPLVKVYSRFRASRVWQAPNGDLLVDFGQNIAGVIRVVIEACSEGDEICFEHGEVLDENGNFTYAFTGTNIEQKDIYICKGLARETFEPKFTYHGFRYVRVTGGSAWKAEQFEALAIGTDNPVTGSFVCSDQQLNRLQDNIYWSQRSNNIGIPTDCPTREKAGWTGDVVVYGPTALYNQNMTAFYIDWLRSIRTEQTAGGHVLNTVPQIKNYVQQSMAGSLGWGDVILTLPWNLYKTTGDRLILEENYEAMGRWLGAMQSAARDNLIQDGFHFGDWLVPSVKNEQGFSDGPASSFLTMNYVGTTLLAADADLYAVISEILGKDEAAREYRTYADRVRSAFCQAYVDDQGHLKQEMQGNYILALVHHMLPKEKEHLLAARLDELIAENDDCLDTGFMSVAYILDVLCDYGYEERAWKVLWQNKCPSWLYEIEHGATTMWENWDAVKEDGQVDGCSFNHYAFGCVGDFLYRRILGLQNAGTAYDKIRIAPMYQCGLDWVKGNYQSDRGEFQIEWKKTDGQYTISGSVPPNCEAALILPDGSCEQIGNGSFKREHIENKGRK